MDDAPSLSDRTPDDSLIELARLLERCRAWATTFRKSLARPASEADQTPAPVRLRALSGMRMAEDHMTAMARLVRPPFEQPFALLALARASIEASARVWFLMDPALDDRKRLERHLNEELHDALQLHKLGLLEEEQSRELIEVIQRAATRRRMRVHRNAEGLAIRIGPPRLLARELVGRLFSAELGEDHGHATYRLYSASVHAGSLAMSAQAAAPDFAIDATPDVQPSADDAVIAVSNTVWGWVFAHDHLVASLGLAPEVWHGWKQYALLDLDRIRKAHPWQDEEPSSDSATA